MIKWISIGIIAVLTIVITELLYIHFAKDDKKQSKESQDGWFAIKTTSFGLGLLISLAIFGGGGYFYTEFGYKGLISSVTALIVLVIFFWVNKKVYNKIGEEPQKVGKKK